MSSVCRTSTSEYVPSVRPTSVKFPLFVRAALRAHVTFMLDEMGKDPCGRMKSVAHEGRVWVTFVCHTKVSLAPLEREAVTVCRE